MFSYWVVVKRHFLFRKMLAFVIYRHAHSHKHTLSRKPNSKQATHNKISPNPDESEFSYTWNFCIFATVGDCIVVVIRYRRQWYMSRLSLDLPISFSLRLSTLSLSLSLFFISHFRPFNYICIITYQNCLHHHVCFCVYVYETSVECKSRTVNYFMVHQVHQMACVRYNSRTGFTTITTVHLFSKYMV